MVEITRKNVLLRKGFNRFVPNYLASSVLDINFQALKHRGIEGVAFDFDDTLVPDGEKDIDTAIVEYLRRQRDARVIKKLAIATNRSERQLGTFADALHADALIVASPMHRKPRRSFYKKLIDAMGIDPGKIAMVGDKIIQDVYGANRSGLTSILVEQVGPARWTEEKLIAMWRRQHPEA